MNKFILLILSVLAFSGCVGIGIPSPMQWKPYTMLSEGDQLGRDQLASRYLVATRLAPIKGLEGNEILTILGQPSAIEVKERFVSEDWHYVYYKRYKTWPRTDKGYFIIRMYQGKALDVFPET